MTFCVVEFSYFGLCKVPCTEGLRSSVVYLGDFLGEDKLGARDRIFDTKVARRACAGQTFPRVQEGGFWGPRFRALPGPQLQADTRGLMGWRRLPWRPPKISLQQYDMLLALGGHAVGGRVLSHRSPRPMDAFVWLRHTARQDRGGIVGDLPGLGAGAVPHIACCLRAMIPSTYSVQTRRIRREETPEAAPGALKSAVGGGCQSGWGRLLSVTIAIEAGTCRQGDSGCA